MHKKSTKKDAVENSRSKISRPLDDVDEAVDTTHGCLSTDNSCGEKTIKKVLPHISCRDF
jgi:hypothetical protein